MAATAFPNYTNIPSRLTVKAWQTLRVGSLLGGRAVLTDVSAILAARLRHASDQIAGWTG